MKLTTLEQVQSGGRTYIVLFGRGDNNERKMKVIKDFKPYFYIPFVDKPDQKVKTYPTIDGYTVTKRYCRVPQDVPVLSRTYENSWEADVHFTTRYLIDEVDKIDKCNLRIQYTDIEKDPTTNQIISIAVYDTYLEKCIAFAWRSDLKHTQYTKNYTFPSGYKFSASVHLYSSLGAMLSDYMKFVRETDPDILTGWFFVKYDMKEIIKGIHSVGLKPSSLSPIKSAYLIGEKVGKYEENIAIKGRVLWDMLKAYASLQPTRLRDSSLEAISQKELKEGKLQHRSFKSIWQNIDELVEYNCKDSVLVYRIDQKKHILKYYDTLRRFVGCEWSALFSETLVWDTYLLRKLHNTLVLPTKKKTKSGKMKGATVLSPLSKGIHRNIILIDLKSLYPSIIMTFNMSPETLIHDRRDGCVYLPNGIGFKTDKVGLLPEVLDELMALRQQYKDTMNTFPYESPDYKAWYMMQETTKILMNSLYGAMKFENFRLCTPDIASAITFCGRSILAFVEKTVEQLGFKVLYGDTDSVFVYANSNNPEDIVKEMHYMITELNKRLPSFIKDFGNSDNCRIIIEPKKIYSALIMSEKKSGKKGVAKKCYAGLIMHAKGKFLDQSTEEALEIMGYSGKRSDSSELSRDVQKKVIRMLLEGKEQIILKLYIEDVINKLSNGKYEPEYVGIPRGLSMRFDAYAVDNPHRRGAMYSNEHLGANFGMGDKPKIIYVSSTGNYPHTDAVAFMRNEDLPVDFIMDIQTMINKSIEMKIEHILDAAGMSFMEVLHGKPLALENFF